MSETSPYYGTLSFRTLINKYIQMQSMVTSMVRSVASRMSAATPGKFLLIQFAMAQVAQIGESISNLLSQVNSVIGNAIRNQKTG
jgi:hypothetical protein